MGEKGNVSSEAASLADRTMDAAGKTGDAAIGMVAGTATGVATSRIEKRFDDSPEGEAGGSAPTSEGSPETN
jgi:hypothetical protein